MSRGSFAAVMTGVLLFVSVGASSAFAAPGYRVESIPSPTVFSPSYETECVRQGSAGPEPGSCNSYIVTVANSGDTPTSGPITISDVFPPGMEVQFIHGEDAEDKSVPDVSCSLALAQCTVSGVMQPDDVVTIYVYVALPLSSPSTLTSSVVVSGGGVATPAVASFRNAVGTALPPPGLNNFTLALTGQNGALYTQAGGHPNEATASFDFNTYIPPDAAIDRPFQGTREAHERYDPVQDVKTVYVDLPPGFVGNPQAAGQCKESELLPHNGASSSNCPPGSEVGTISLDEDGKLFGTAEREGLLTPSPIFSMVPEQGYPAEFGFLLSGQPIMIYSRAVPTPQGYVLQVFSPGIPRVLGISAIALSFWGVPAEASHDALRGVQSGVPPAAFLTNPVDCEAGPLTATAMADTWEKPGQLLADGSPDVSDPNWQVIKSVVYPSITGCDALQFTPSIEVTPQSTQADEPTGLTVNIGVPQSSQLEGSLASPELKNAIVTLPSGVSISPSAGDGLQACTAEEIALESSEPGSCPDGSVLGTVKITTPLLAAPIEGQIFLGAPGCNPCSDADAADGNMYHLYLEAAGSGVVIKKEGTIYANTATGQLTTKFTENPQLPFSDLQVQFKGGLRASLATPQSCGTFTTTTDLTPWSSPITPDAAPSSAFNVSWDGQGEACPASIPFAPSLSAGTSNPNAGQYSPLTFTFSREDREQDIAGIQVTTPPGLLGSLSGIPLCGEPQADLGTCSEASRIGSMTVAAGPGGHPFYQKGSLYLTGPYKGAPFGLSIVVPTAAGPFNLGNVVVRAKININPTTAALTVTSDPLPQILDGIPLRLRTANVTVDRPGFIFNPSNCAQQSIGATLTGAQGAVSSSSVPFAVSGCAGLPFAPKFSVSTSGHTSRAYGASLDAKLTLPPGAQSNISRVKVELPKQLPSRLTTLQKACPDSVFEANPAACPSASLIGYARAVTPILPVPLAGPAYFVSHGGAAFPDLVVILQGYGVRVDLTGSTFISKAGITSSTFATVPDVPVSTFELYLPEGPDSALAANGNLCKQKLVLPTSFTAQDGAQLNQNTRLQVTGCPKSKTKSKKAKKARKSARRGGAGQRGGK